MQPSHQNRWWRDIAESRVGAGIYAGHDPEKYFKQGGDDGYHADQKAHAAAPTFGGGIKNETCQCKRSDGQNKQVNGFRLRRETSMRTPARAINKFPGKPQNHAEVT